MRTAIICAFTLAIIVTVIDGVPGRRRDLVKGRGGLNPRERGEGMRTQMRRGRKLERQSIVVKGNDCEFIYLADITSNSGCSNGQKFVLKVHFYKNSQIILHRLNTGRQQHTQAILDCQ